MKKHSLLLAASLISLCAGSALASGDQKHPKQRHWPFDGMFGRVDKTSAQRGFQVYKEVCSACHGLSRVSFRNLEQLGFSEAEVKALAATYEIKDGPNDEGEMFTRPGLPSDSFVPPFANENAARASNNAAYPPDLSLIIKARADGANYVYSLLTGYEPAPAGFELGEGQHYNPYMPGGRLAMPQPLNSEGQVSYSDGTAATVEQMTVDVVNFLQWAAEPEMESRKQMGIKTLIYLAIFTVFMYLAKRNLWKKIH
ncbi:MAG: cytochrome c1 [Proteobacteria bacterium]|nr:cytochrome c1 [Pseudomonadota bacterium]